MWNAKITEFFYRMIISYYRLIRNLLCHLATLLHRLARVPRQRHLDMVSLRRQLPASPVIVAETAVYPQGDQDVYAPDLSVDQEPLAPTQPSEAASLSATTPSEPHLVTAQVPLSTRQVIESLLFVAGEPVTVAQLARTLQLPADTVETALAQLAEEYRERGIRLQRHGDTIQLVSAPEAALAVARFLGIQATTRLSTAALEVLAIIAYRQPLTRAQIEDIRGVDSSSVIRALLARELIADVGRLETVGRPILYATTPTFLRQFGLTSLDDLPPLDIPLPPDVTDE